MLEGIQRLVEGTVGRVADAAFRDPIALFVGLVVGLLVGFVAGQTSGRRLSA